MTGAVFLEGEQVNLRTIEEEDLEFIRDGFNHPEVRKYLDNREPQNLEQERDFFENVVCQDEPVNLAITVDEDIVGLIDLTEKRQGVGEIGIWLHPELHGNGYGTEACELLIQYAFDEGRYERIQARTMESNSASRGIWEKLGFSQEGQLRNHVFHEGTHEDTLIYGILKEEW